MTAPGPYSMATLIYESPPPNAIGIIATPKTILSSLASKYPSFLNLVEMARLLRLYNEIGDRYGSLTVFVPKSPFIPAANIETALEICKASTIKGKIDDKTLSSSSIMTLNTLSPSNDIIVKTDPNTNYTYINGSKLIKGLSEECTNGIIHVVDTLVW